MRAVVLAAVSVLALAGASPARAADEAQFRLDFEAYLGGFRVMSVASEGRYGPGGYAIEAAARTRGVVGWFGDWIGRGVSDGAVKGGGLVPRVHRDESTWRGDKRFVEMNYAADGSVAVRAEPPPEKDNRDPVPAGEMMGTVDALTAALTLIRRVNAAGACAGEARIFDGRRRFDLRLSGGEQVVLTKSDQLGYGGPALKCAGVVRRIAGFWKGTEYRLDDDKPSHVWLARLSPAGPLLPVRMEIEIGIGTLVVNYSQPRPNGAN
jgi:hypothetical protein